MNDIGLLQYLGVRYICDLMVESRKVKYFVNVCSSEKVDSEKRYQNAGFEIVVAPYPGCEFFCIFSNKKHCGMAFAVLSFLPPFSSLTGGSNACDSKLQQRGFGTIGNKTLQMCPLTSRPTPRFLFAGMITAIGI